MSLFDRISAIKASQSNRGYVPSTDYEVQTVRGSPKTSTWSKGALLERIALIKAKVNSEVERNKTVEHFAKLLEQTTIPTELPNNDLERTVFQSRETNQPGEESQTHTQCQRKPTYFDRPLDGVATSDTQSLSTTKEFDDTLRMAERERRRVQRQARRMKREEEYETLLLELKKKRMARKEMLVSGLNKDSL